MVPYTLPYFLDLLQYKKLPSKRQVRYRPCPFRRELLYSKHHFIRFFSVFAATNRLIKCFTWNIFVYDTASSGDCLLPALVHRTFACMSASLWTASSSARQTAHLSVSISTTATKHLPSCAHKAGLSFAKILNCGGHFCSLSKSWQTKSD